MADARAAAVSSDHHLISHPERRNPYAVFVPAGGGPGAGARDDRWLTLTQLVPTMRESEPTVITPQQVLWQPQIDMAQSDKHCTSVWLQNSMSAPGSPLQTKTFHISAPSICMRHHSLFYTLCRRHRCCCHRGRCRRGDRPPPPRARYRWCWLCRWTPLAAKTAALRPPVPVLSCCRTGAGTAPSSSRRRCRPRAPRMAACLSRSSW